MSAMKVLTILGTRPEAIKLAPVILELEKRRADAAIESVVCITGQHRQMLDQALDLFGIVPRYDLDVMTGNQSPTQSASRILAELEPILNQEQPDWVLVQGDTTSAMAAALAAFYASARIGHVEAGLRTGNKQQPFPEEINRRVASVVADLHFAPTESAKQNLLCENIPEQDILVTGNPVIDAVYWAARMPFDYRSAGLEHLTAIPPATRLILVTAHRRENFGIPLRNICLALQQIASQYADRVHIVYPVHMNPNVHEPVHDMLDGIANITLTPPLDYLALVQLLQRSYLVLTDSGGIQEEAPALGVPVLVLREVTERPEAIKSGCVKLVGTGSKHIVAEVTRLLEDSEAHREMARPANVYGDGRAAQRIVGVLLGEPVQPFESEVGP